MTKFQDPTYIKSAINTRPEWRLAFRLSEVDNDNAPIGWSRYIPLANWLLNTFELREKKNEQEIEGSSGQTTKS